MRDFLVHRKIRQRESLFLSHGGSSDETLALVDEAAAGLRNQGFEVFEYRRIIKSPERWRFSILVGLLACDYGIVLLDNRAKLRKWVRYEAAVFEAREFMEPEFTFCKISVDHTSRPDRIIKQICAALPSSDIPTRDHDFLTHLDKAVISYPEIIDDIQCKTCIEAIVLETKLAKYLRLEEIPATALEEMSRDLENLPSWEESDIDWRTLQSLEAITESWRGTRSHDIFFDLPKTLIRKGLYAGSVIARYAGANFHETEFSKVMMLLISLMTPLRAVLPLAELFARETLNLGPYVVTAINGVQVIAAIRRAWGIERGPLLRAPIIELGDRGSKGEFIDIIEMIEDSLEKLFKIAPKGKLLLDEMIHNKMPSINCEDQNAELSFVLLPEVFALEIIEQLQLRYPNFVFIVVQHSNDAPPNYGVALGDVGSPELVRLYEYALEEWHSNRH